MRCVDEGRTVLTPRAEGWSFDGRGEYDGQGSSDGKGDLANCIADPVYNSGKLSDLYFKADKTYDARFTVPIVRLLVDRAHV